MKKLFRIAAPLMLGVLLGLSLSSCSKMASDEKNIIGKWQSTSVNEKDYEAGKLVSENTTNCVDWYLGFNFKEDGTGQMIYFEEGEAETVQGTWVIMSDKLIVTAKGDSNTEESSTFNIKEIKSDTMVLSMTEEGTSNGIKYENVMTYTFRKLK